MKRILAPIALALALAPRIAPALDVYLVRHGETMGNVTGHYTEENQRTFSERGLRQIDALTERLGGMAFDQILVSPLWRTQKTILPHLQQAGRQAEIWPELMESDCGVSGDEPAVAAIPEGGDIELLDSALFRFRDEQSRRLYACTTAAEALAQVRRGVDLLLERYRASNASVLLVGHGCTGGRMAELLLGLKPRGRFSPENTALFHIRIDGQGRAELLLINGRPPTFFERFILTDGAGPDLPGFVNLEGLWKIHAGDDPDWASPGVDDEGWPVTRVPGIWERDALSGYDGIAWYRLRFGVPEADRAAWGSNGLVLVMGGVDDADETYLNGALIGRMGDFDPKGRSAYRRVRQYRFAQDHLAEENILAVRVSDWGGGGGLWCPPVLLGPASALPAH